MVERYVQQSLFDVDSLADEPEKEEKAVVPKSREWRVPDFTKEQCIYVNVETSEHIFLVNSKDGANKFLCFRNPFVTIVNLCGVENESDLLSGKEKVVWPALYVGFYNNDGTEAITRYSDDVSKDDRQQLLVGYWHMNEVSTNRTHSDRKAEKFYELQFSLPEYIAWLKNDAAERKRKHEGGQKESGKED